MKIRGRIVAGLGVGGKYVSHPYYEARFRELLGCRPYPGTMNLDTNIDWRELASNCIPEVIEETLWDGVRLGAVYVWRVASLTPCRSCGTPILLIRPLLSRHPHNVLELVACEKLRPLISGDEVVVEVECKRNPLYTKPPRIP